METVKILSKVSTFADVQKSLQEIEKILNGLISSTRTEAESETAEEEGQTGDIQITQNLDKSYTFEIRTEEGWKTPVVGDSAVKFKNKPTFKDTAKSIDKIEEEDTITAGKTAEKVIFDEKADKFILPRADYDSGWIATAGVTLDHNLETENFSLCQIFHNNDPDNTSNRLINQGTVSVITVNENQIAVSVIGVSIGYTRIRLWK